MSPDTTTPLVRTWSTMSSSDASGSRGRALLRRGRRGRRRALRDVRRRSCTEAMGPSAGRGGRDRRPARPGCARPAGTARRGRRAPGRRRRGARSDDRPPTRGDAGWPRRRAGRERGRGRPRPSSLRRRGRAPCRAGGGGARGTGLRGSAGRSLAGPPRARAGPKIRLRLRAVPGRPTRPGRRRGRAAARWRRAGRACARPRARRSRRESGAAGARPDIGAHSRRPTAECATAHRDTASRSRTRRSSGASPYRESGASATTSHSSRPTASARGLPAAGDPRRNAPERRRPRTPHDAVDVGRRLPRRRATARLPRGGARAAHDAARVQVRAQLRRACTPRGGGATTGAKSSGQSLPPGPGNRAQPMQLRRLGASACGAGAAGRRHRVHDQGRHGDAQRVERGQEPLGLPAGQLGRPGDRDHAGRARIRQQRDQLAEPAREHQDPRRARRAPRPPGTSAAWPAGRWTHSSATAGQREQAERVTGRRGVEDDQVVARRHAPRGSASVTGEKGEQLVDAGRGQVHQVPRDGSRSKATSSRDPRSSASNSSSTGAR